MLLYDVPFLPEEGYTRFLASVLADVYSLHFSLHMQDLPDARLTSAEVPAAELVRLLKQLPGPKKYVLLNACFHAPAQYADANQLAEVAGKLASLREADCLDGVIYADHYYLTALSDIAPGLASRLEAVPSVNLGLDGFDKIRAIFHHIGRTNFRPPKKLILDRSLNRRMHKLRAVSAKVREHFPGVALELLANEGCLYRCPHAPAHAAQMAHARAKGVDETFALNREYGCARTFFAQPEECFKSPFIRPEDQDAYAEYADVIKLCGRSRGAATMQRIITAYLDRHYEGNLLELLDSQESLAERMEIDNQSLPPDFMATLAHCHKFCLSCSYCVKLARKHVRILERIPWKRYKQE